MAYNSEYPNYDPNLYNDDWVIMQVKRLAEEWKNVQNDWKNQQEAYQNLVQYIENYFDKLDVSGEINSKINSMVQSGEFYQIVQPAISDAVDKWLKQNVTPTTPIVDKTLTIDGAAADAKVVGNIGYLYRGFIPTGTTVLANITELGTYAIESSQTPLLTDIPDDATGTMLMENMRGFNGSIILQKLYKTANANRPWYRNVNINTHTASGWSSDNNMYLYRGFIPTGTTILANLTDLGTYAIESSQTSLLTDIPSELSGTLMVENMLGFNGQVIIQKIYKTILGNNPYFRTVNIVNKTAGPWNFSGGYTSPLYGKKWLCIGDSFTAGDFTGTDVPRIESGLYAGNIAVYPYLIGNITGITVSNASIQGMRIGGANGYAATWLQQITDAYDYITIALGINDLPDHQNTPLGTLDDNTYDTFYGAWNVLMERIYNVNPTAHIGIIITNGISYDYIDYVNAMIEIAEYWCVPYINMSNGIQVPTLNRSAKNPSLHSAIALNARNNAFQVSDTNGHPNAKAHQYESIFLSNWLQTI